MRSVLKDKREENGFVQVTFARRIGAAQSLVSDVENGRRDMTPGFAMKAAPALGVNPVLLLAGHEYEKVAQKAEENDPAAPREALALAEKLLEILEEPGALDEEVADEVREVVGKLLELLEGATAAGGPTKPGGLDKPVVPAAAAAKASPDGKMDALRRLGAMRDAAIDENTAFERLVDAGIPAETLEQLLDQISTRLSHSRVGAVERQNLKALQAAMMRRIADLGEDGDRSSFQELAGDRVAATKAAASEARGGREHVESMRELGLDVFGRPVPKAQRDHEKVLKSSEYDLTEDEIQTGTSRRGLPLIGKELERRRRI